MLISACLLSLLGTTLASQGVKDAEDTTTVLGCIQRSQQNYVVTDNHGTSYLLDGVGDQLSGEVGHTLEVKGKLIEPPKPTRNLCEAELLARAIILARGWQRCRSRA